MSPFWYIWTKNLAISLQRTILFNIQSLFQKNKNSFSCVSLRLSLLSGKTLIFTNSLSKSYKLKLFLDQFGITAGVLNGELPVTSRCETIEEFNEGVSEHLIACGDAVYGQQKQKQKKQKKAAPSRLDEESDTSRGIDFKSVSNVVNFDLPDSSSSYVHRVGRTARAGSTGIALSFVGAADKESLKNVEEFIGEPLTPYNFDPKEVEGFKYRVDDVLSRISKKTIRLFRMREIRNQVLKSKKLSKFLDDNPREKEILRAGIKSKSGSGGVLKKRAYMKQIPSYMMPTALKSGFKKPKGSPEDHPES